jgi:hypothetical protein
MASKSRKRAGRGGRARTDECTREQKKLLKSLKAHGQVQEVPPGQVADPLAPGVTHTIETKPDGTKVLVRKRFSAI